MIWHSHLPFFLLAFINHWTGLMSSMLPGILVILKDILLLLYQTLHVCKIYLHSQQLVMLSEGQRFWHVQNCAETSWFWGRIQNCSPAERCAPDRKGLVLTLQWHKAAVLYWVCFSCWCTLICHLANTSQSILFQFLGMLSFHMLS